MKVLIKNGLVIDPETKQRKLQMYLLKMTLLRKYLRKLKKMQTE